MAKTKRPRTGRGKVILAVVCIVVIAVAAFFVYRSISDDAQAEVTYTTGTAQKMTLTSSVSGTGNVELSESAGVSPTVSGEVIALSAGLGDSVNKGDVLFALANQHLDVAVAEAQNAYDKAVLGVEQAELDVLQAKKDLSTLYDRSHTSLQVKQAKAAISAAELSVVAAQNKVSSAEIALQEAKDDATARTVMAPLTGVITDISVENGDSIEAAAGGGSDPITITDPSRFQVTTTLAESDIIDVEVGQKAVLTFDALPDLTLSGRVTRVDSAGGNDQGVVSYSVVIIPDAMDPSVRGGMTVSVNIITDIAADVLAVPSAAVKSSAGGKYVQILQNGQPVNVAVEVGMSNDSYTEITSGLTEGQEIITATTTVGGTTATTVNRFGGPGMLEVGGGVIIEGNGPGLSPSPGQ